MVGGLLAEKDLYSLPKNFLTGASATSKGSDIVGFLDWLIAQGDESANHHNGSGSEC